MYPDGTFVGFTSEPKNGNSAKAELYLFFPNEVHIKKLVIIKYLRAIVAWFVELLDMKLKSNTEDDTVFLSSSFGF